MKKNERGRGGISPCATELCISEPQNYVYFQNICILGSVTLCPPPLPLSFFSLSFLPS